ncbi:MAG: protein phosphatase 2C domain-containing protein [Candidatus Nanopelagicales bacterium]
MTFALRFAARSDVGMVRQGNEDSGYAGPRLLVVADGMGGHAAGELASAAAVATMAELELSDPAPESVLAGLAAAVDAAGANIGQVVSDHPDFAGMGTTVTALFWQGERVAVVHVGDSRAYLLREGDLGQITHDHTYVQTLVDSGRISADDAAVHPRRSLLMRAVDGVQPVEADLSVREARPGDRYLLCSDGLTGVVSDEELAAILSEGEPTGTVITLVELALSRGAPDNVTVVVADVLNADEASDEHLLDLEPVVVGAAGDPRVRAQLPQVHFPDDAQPDPNRPDLPADVTGGPPTSEIPAVTGAVPMVTAVSGMSDRARRIWRWSLTSLAAVLVVTAVVGGLGAWWWTNQWYVGSAQGKVTVFQGVSGSIAGIPMQVERQSTDVMVSSLPAFDVELVNRGIVAADQADAERIAAELGLRALECEQRRPPAGCPTLVPEQ